MNIAAVAEWVTWYILVSSWAVVAAHQFFSTREGRPWWSGPMGWHVMSFAAVIAVVFTLLGVADVWPRLALHSWYQWVYVAVVAGIGGVLNWRLAIMIGLYRGVGSQHGDTDNR